MLHGRGTALLLAGTLQADVRLPAATPEDAPHLSPIVRTCEAIQEEVRGVIQIVDGSCDGHLATEHLQQEGVVSAAVEGRVEADAVKKLKAPGDEIRQRQQYETPGYRQQDDGQLEPDPVLLEHDPLRGLRRADGVQLP